MAALEADQARHLQVSPWGLTAMVFVVCSAFSSQMVMPMWIGAIIADDHMTAQTAGSIASLELVMVAVVSVLAAPMVNRIDRRALCLVGVLLLMAGNAASSLARAPELLATLRAICGVGKGLTVVGIFSAVGQMKDPTRGFAILNAAYAGFSAFYFLVIPHEIRSLGASGAFRAIFVVTSVALLLLPFVPAGRPETQVQTSTPYPWFVERRGVMVLAGLAAMWVGYNAIWIFIQQLGAQHALNLAQIGGVLSFGALLTIAGPVLERVAKSGNRFSHQTRSKLLKIEHDSTIKRFRLIASCSSSLAGDAVRPDRPPCGRLFSLGARVGRCGCAVRSSGILHCSACDLSAGPLHRALRHGAPLADRRHRKASCGRVFGDDARRLLGLPRRRGGAHAIRRPRTPGRQSGVFRNRAALDCAGHTWDRSRRPPDRVSPRSVTR